MQVNITGFVNQNICNCSSASTTSGRMEQQSQQSATHDWSTQQIKCQLCSTHLDLGSHIMLLCCILCFQECIIDLILAHFIQLGQCKQAQDSCGRGGSRSTSRATADTQPQRKMKQDECPRANPMMVVRSSAAILSAAGACITAMSMLIQCCLKLHVSCSVSAAQIA